MTLRQSGKMLTTVIGLYAFLAVIIVVFGFPLLWVVSLSLKELREVFQYPPRLIPERLAFENYVYVLKHSPMVVYIANSLKIVVATVLGTLLFAVPSGYVLSRIRFRTKGGVLLGILAFQMISPLVIAIPLYRYFSSLGLLNTHFGTVLVYVAWQVPFATWVMKGFLDSIPTSLDEAACIDGCTRLQALLRVVLPISLPGLASTIILTAINSWSQFVIPFILLDKACLFPVSVGILNFQSTADTLSTHLLAAASVVSILPAMLIFVLLQRLILGALTAGAVKG